MTSQSNFQPQASAAPQPAAYTDQYATVAGLKLHYQDYGTAGKTPMLCVHGGAASGHWFDFIAPAFTADYHMLAIDQRGHGDSAWAVPADYTYDRYAADLDEVVTRLNLRDFVLVGHSMGGAVSLTYAAKYPGRVKRLIIVDTSMHLAPERIAKLREVGTRPGRTYATREDFVARFRLRPGDSKAVPEVLNYLANIAAHPQPDGSWGHKFDRQVYAVRESMDGLPYWNNIHIPALLVKGGHSERITPEILAEVKSRCPHVDFAEVPASDHHVTLDNPAGFTHAVNAFLAKHKT